MTDAATRLTALAERIELWPVERLRPYERNPRTHSEDQVAQIAASMVEFGFTNPILVDESNGIIAGHGRLLAARKLGLAEVPVMRLEHLSEAQKRAYVIADNQLALNAGWDEAAAGRGGRLAAGRAVRSRPARLRRRRAGAAAGARRRRGGGRARGRGARAARGAGHPAGRSLAAGRAPAALRRRHRAGRCRAGARRRAGRHGLHRPALQCRLRQLAQGQAARQGPARSSTTISAAASRRS